MSSKTVGQRASHLDAQASAILRGIPGVTNVFVTVHPSMMAVGLISWSPTLHALDMFERYEHTGAGDAFVEMARWFSTIARVLDGRSLSAATMGTRKPLDPTAARIDHLHVDATLAAMARDDGKDVIAVARTMVHRAHRGSLSRHSFDAWLTGDDARLHEHPSTGLREVGWKVQLGAEDETLVYDGFQLTFRGDPIPETMLAAMSGRRVDALVSTGTPLDARPVQTVLSVEVDGVMHYAMRPVPDPVPLQHLV